jgi:uncharacterized membrane protein
LDMDQTVAGVFDDIKQAHRVVQDLVGHGFPHRSISLVTRDEKSEYAKLLEHNQPESLTKEGAGGGAVIGGLTGLLIGLGALTIPGIGPVLAAGPLFGIVGAGVGALTGGIVGALVDVGLPEQTAQHYAEAVRRGATLVMVTTDPKLADRATQIINRHQPTNLEGQATQWRESGWTNFDPNAEPYTTMPETSPGGNPSKASDESAVAGVG